MQRNLTRGLVTFALAMALGVSLSPVSSAGNPLKKLVSFKRVEAKEGEMYPISETNGPWMILATTFRGERADEFAQSLVYELRKRYKLPAYSYEMKVDLSAKVEAKGIDRYGNPRRGNYKKREVIREVAVLVGDYPSIEDREAQATLRRIQSLEPDALKVQSGVDAPTQPFKHWRMARFTTNQGEGRRGPMGMAFVSTNPILPPEYFVPKGVENFVIELNRGVEHSLLDCPGKYSIQVALFHGKTITTNEKKYVDMMSNNKQLDRDGSKLEAAAEKAHRVTTALRAQGYEAYEFHDRYASIVCVGSFDRLGSELPDGQTDLDPRVLKIMKNLGAAPAKGGGQGKPKQIDKIPLLAQPIPVEVPRPASTNRLTHQR